MLLRIGLLTCHCLTPSQVWDVVKGACEHTLRCHTDKVQAVAWNPAESPVLLTGSFDRSVCLVSGAVGRDWTRSSWGQGKRLNALLHGYQVSTAQAEGGGDRCNEAVRLDTAGYHVLGKYNHVMPKHATAHSGASMWAESVGTLTWRSSERGDPLQGGSSLVVVGAGTHGFGEGG